MKVRDAYAERDWLRQPGATLEEDKEDSVDKA